MSQATQAAAEPRALQVQSWRIYTPEEFRLYLKGFSESPGRRKRAKRRPAVLAVRDRISTLDMYCYLKARFGDPNGFQTFLASDDSDNLFHWDYSLKAGGADIHISGMSRETHFAISEKLTDTQWRDLIVAIRADFARVGQDKSGILKSLEKWSVFQNRFVEIADACSSKHAVIADYIANKPGYFSISTKSKRDAKSWGNVMADRNRRRAEMAQACLELSLLTPVMAEAFINMVILMLCKPEVRDNRRHFDSFIRCQIDVKVFDLHLKCIGFVSGINSTSPSFSRFKQVMDKRNHETHGNIDPDREKIETVYFDGKRPLFTETGDHIGKFVESIEKQASPEVVLKDYEDTHEFLASIVSCLDTQMQPSLWRVMDDSHPGYDAKRKKVGALFPDHVVMGTFEGLRYDTDLAVTW